MEALEHIGIGLKQVSTLKNEEYCSHGIPFIYGYEDPGFQENFAFALQLPANDDPADIRLVVDFYQQVRKIPDYPMKMWDFACSKLDWYVKMSERMLL